MGRVTSGIQRVHERGLHAFKNSRVGRRRRCATALEQTCDKWDRPDDDLMFDGSARGDLRGPR